MSIQVAFDICLAAILEVAEKERGDVVEEAGLASS
jgi:hypothetical protein